MALKLPDNGGRRLGVDRRQFSYDFYIPEHRCGKERRSGLDRRLKPRILKEQKYVKQALSLIGAAFSIIRHLNICNKTHVSRQ